MDICNEYGNLERQKELLEILKDVNDFCKNNNIKYSLAFGTLLGAIRHDGFIPWDDDADIMMDRNNFEKFIALKDKFNNFFVEEELWIRRIKNLNFPNATIDIFIVDDVPKHEILQKFKVLCLRVLQGTLKEDIDYSKYSFFYRICLLVTHVGGSVIPNDLKITLYDKLSIFGSKESEYKCIYNNLFSSMTRRYDSKILDNYSMHKFENFELMITDRWELNLIEVYGDDYMQPPSEIERRTGTFNVIQSGVKVKIENSKHS